MENPWERLRRKMLPTPEEKMLDELARDINSFEAQTWVMQLIDFMAFHATEDMVVPLDTLDRWRSLGDFQKELAFMYLLGAVKSLMEPPSEDHAALI